MRPDKSAPIAQEFRAELHKVSGADLYRITRIRDGAIIGKLVRDADGWRYHAKNSAAFRPRQSHETAYSALTRHFPVADRRRITAALDAAASPTKIEA